MLFKGAPYLQIFILEQMTESTTCRSDISCILQTLHTTEYTRNKTSLRLRASVIRKDFPPTL